MRKLTIHLDDMDHAELRRLASLYRTSMAAFGGLIVSEGLARRRLALHEAKQRVVDHLEEGAPP